MSAHLSLSILMRLTCPSTLPEGQPGDDRVLFDAQAGNERLQYGLSSGDSSDYPLVEVAATAAGNDRGEGLDVRDD
jgi:hypothetical protein